MVSQSVHLDICPLERKKKEYKYNTFKTNEEEEEKEEEKDDEEEGKLVSN